MTLEMGIQSPTICELEKELNKSEWKEVYVGLWISSKYPKAFIDTNTEVGAYYYEGVKLKYGNVLEKLITKEYVY